MPQAAAPLALALTACAAVPPPPPYGDVPAPPPAPGLRATPRDARGPEPTYLVRGLCGHALRLTLEGARALACVTGRRATLEGGGLVGDVTPNGWALRAAQ